MRVALVSDIHANLPALEAVMRDLDNRGGTSALYSLGDMVGYGPHPNEVVQLLRDRDALCVLGNHDAAAVGLISTEAFNPVAAAANEWTAAQLTRETAVYLGKLPEVAIQEPFTVVHGSLRDPLWEYLVTHDAARAQLAAQTTPYSAVGHTHLPLIAWDDGTGVQAHQPGDEETVVLRSPSCINPGSVGQPRDGDPRASYAIIEITESAATAEFIRVSYDIDATAAAIRTAGLPEPLATRLASGR